MHSDRQTALTPVTDEEAEAVLAACRVLVGLSAQSIATAENVVSLTEFRMLVILATMGPGRVTELADRAGIDSSLAWRLCERLASVNFVALAGPDDLYGRTVSVTAQGQGVVHMVTSRRRAALEPILTHMPATSRNDLVHALRDFADAASEPSVRDLWAMGWTH